MKNMKRIVLTLALACISVLALAQNSSLLRPRIEIADTSSDDVKSTQMEVFYMDDESPRMYYISLGHLGIGPALLQVDFDPVFEVFLPLGGTLDEAIGRLEEIKELFKMPRLESTEITGSFAALYPKNDEPVTFTVTSRKVVFSKVLEFSLPTGSEGIIRALHITKSDFNSILFAVKFHKRLHPNE